MAFEPKKKEMEKALNGNKTQDTSKRNENNSVVLPVFKKEEKELRESFLFTLKPSVRRKMDRIAKKQGYEKSTSAFLNDFFEEMEE